MTVATHKGRGSWVNKSMVQKGENKGNVEGLLWGGHNVHRTDEKKNPQGGRGGE